MLTPVIMKKGRSGTLLTPPSATPPSSRPLRAVPPPRTTTLGVRIRHDRRVCLDRTHTTVHTPYGPIRIKQGLQHAEILNATPEYEDCRAAALAHRVPLKQVLQAATAAFETHPAGAEMTPDTLLALLAAVQRGEQDPQSAAARLATLPFEDAQQTLAEARIDHHRTLRIGLPEVTLRRRQNSRPDR